MAALATLTEDTIRSRVNLKHDNLEDVKSLSLPGTYHEKVAELGTSLRKFTRLKHLDLSRNALTSLAGLEHLNLLETLNLYYNGISSLDELRPLRHNSQLTEIDLRLNPVARDEPDYRLFLIHLLPNLQKLDDRGVRDRERQAALVHFTSGQAAEFSGHPPVPTPQEKQPHPRAEYVRSVNKRVTALDDDDVEVLDLIARTGGDLSKPRQITGSAARSDDMQEYSLDVLKGLPDSALETRTFPSAPGHKPVTVKNQTLSSDPIPASDPNPLASRYPNIPLVPVTRSRSPSTSPKSVQSNGLQQHVDPNLKYADEAEAYTKFRGQGFFTPHPGYVESDGSAPPPHSLPHPGAPPSPKAVSQTDDGPTDRAEVYTAKQPFPVQKLDFDSTCHQAPPSQQAPPSSGVSFPDNTTPSQRQFLIRLMDLVDKYWNGSRSLHKNHKFKSLAVELLYSLESAQTQRGTLTASDQLRLEDRVTSLTEENRVLREREASYKQITTTSSLNETELKASLKQAYEDVEALRSHLQKYVNENKRLQQKLSGISANGVGSVNASTVNQSQLDQLERENNDLRQETERLKIRVKQLSQMQEVAAMLQESHKSLVQTNDHLLREIEETRVRHKDEVRQLHWSYDQLKRTMNSLNTSAAMSGTVIE